MTEINAEQADNFKNINKNYNYYMSNVRKRQFDLSKLPMQNNCYLLKSNKDKVTLTDIIKYKIDIMKVNYV